MSPIRHIDRRTGRDLWIAAAAMLVALVCFPWSDPDGTSWVFTYVSTALAVLSVLLLVAASRRRRRARPSGGEPWETPGRQTGDRQGPGNPGTAAWGGRGPAVAEELSQAGYGAAPPAAAPAPAGAEPALMPAAVAAAPRARPMTVLAELAALLSLVVSVIQLFVGK